MGKTENKTENKYRLWGFINPVDVLLVVGIIALVWGASLFAAPKEAAAKPGDVKIRYTVELSKKEAGFYQKIAKGSTLYDNLKGYEIGVIVDTYALPYREDVGDQAGGIIYRAPVEGLEFTYVVVEAAVQVTDYATYVGEYDIFVNKEVFVHAKTFAGQGYIVVMEAVE